MYISHIYTYIYSFIIIIQIKKKKIFNNPNKSVQLKKIFFFFVKIFPSFQYVFIIRNSLLIWARKQRGPYYDPTTRMYHVSHNSKRYFAGYTEQDAEA